MFTHFVVDLSMSVAPSRMLVAERKLQMNIDKAVRWAAEYVFKSFFFFPALSHFYMGSPFWMSRRHWFLSCVSSSPIPLKCMPSLTQSLVFKMVTMHFYWIMDPTLTQSFLSRQRVSSVEKTKFLGLVFGLVQTVYQLVALEGERHQVFPLRCPLPLFSFRLMCHWPAGPFIFNISWQQDFGLKSRKSLTWMF